MLAYGIGAVDEVRCGIIYVNVCVRTRGKAQHNIRVHIGLEIL